MILSDRDLRAEMEAGRLVVEPFDPSAMQPSSIDLRVGNQFRVFANNRYPYIDVRKPLDQLTELVEASEAEPFILHPGEFVLGSTLETVTLPDDLVARLEGKSSLGRLGLLIHSSLPGDEAVLFLHAGELRARPVGEIVRKRLGGAVVAFDPETLVCGYHQITGWFEGLPDRIFQVVLASGRRVHLTGGHDLFTLDGDRELTHLRVNQVGAGVRVAIPRSIPEPAGVAATLGRASMVPESREGRLVSPDTPGVPGLDWVIGREVAWDEVVEVIDTGRVEPVFDLEVRPGGRAIENFVAGSGVFVSNTAGFVDAGWTGQLTLELSNVANLPITIYPGMRIGQLCVFRMSSPAERPYGSDDVGSKYRGQSGPTPSRYHENF